MKKIILAAGGTGGHLFTAVAAAEEFLNRGYELHLITDNRCQKYLESINLPLVTHVIKLTFNTTNLIHKIHFIISILFTGLKLYRKIRGIGAHALIGFGGYPTIPPLIASVILRLPIILHEQNSCIGLSNAIFSFVARAITVTYLNTHKLNKNLHHKIIFTGRIVRSAIRRSRIVSFLDSPFRVLIIGGSQGAAVFTKLMPDVVRLLLHKNPKLPIHITQQVRAEDYNILRLTYNTLNISYRLSEFFKDIAIQYSNNMLVIARAGASTVTELAAIGMPSILIPYPYATDNHQVYNAKILQDNGGSWYFEEQNATALLIADKIYELITNRDTLINASQNLLKIKNNGHIILADTVNKIISS